MRHSGYATLLALLGLASVGHAGFDRVVTELVAQPVIDGIERDVWRVYVQVTNPEDQVTFCSGNDEHPVNIDAGGPNGFYQNETFGPNDIEPIPAFVEVDPDLAYDTFLTIGADALTGPPTVTQNLDSPGWRCTRLFVQNGAWYRLPIAPQTVAGADLRVLIGQFTIDRDATLRGELRMAGVFDGDSGDVYYLELPNLLCDSDVTGDGWIEIDDLLTVILAWGDCDDECACPSDVTLDGTTDVDDLLRVISSWGGCPE